MSTRPDIRTPATLNPAGSIARTAVLPDDYCGNGIEWRTWDALEILGDKGNPPAGQEWLKFNGRWGEYRGSILGDIVEGPTGPAFKKWWKDNGFMSANG